MHTRKKTIVWVSQNNYRWAPSRWPDRDVRIETGLSDNELEITKPGFLYEPKLKRRIKIDNETLISERERTTLSATYSRPVPKRGI